MFSGKDLRLVDETSWTDVDFVRSMKSSAASYYISKTLTETSALEFAETHGLDFVTIIPSFVHGPFITPNCPGSVRTSMAMVFGSEKQIKFYANTNFVHVEDVVSAHIFLLEHPKVKWRYFCYAVDKNNDEVYQFVSARYPEYQIPSAA